MFHVKVAPYVGAWIETKTLFADFLNYASHPMWVRGLKPEPPKRLYKTNTSHPMWVRGLKRLYAALQGEL